jgi:hypothetical protein
MIKKYTIEQINEIVEAQGWSSCLCKDEMDGQECIGVDTIQIAVADDAEHFGEFVGKDNEYEFILYTY